MRGDLAAWFATRPQASACTTTTRRISSCARNPGFQSIVGSMGLANAL